MTHESPTLFAYQREGSKWLTQRTRALLADEMGLGKSAQAITAADALTLYPLLVLCPAVARRNWRAEWEKFSPRTSKVWTVETAAQAKSLPLDGVTICSYDLAQKNAVSSALSAVPWKGVVLDESHYLKNRKAKRTRAILGTIVRRAERVWALSGTPAPNNPSEIWPLLRTFDATKMDYWSFVGRYCTMRETPFGTTITGGRNLDELKRSIAPFVLRRRKEEVMKDLPPIMFSDVLVEPAEVPNAVRDTYFPGYIGFTSDLYAEVDRQQRLVESCCNDLRMGNDALKVLDGLQNKVRSVRQWIGLQKLPAVVELVKSELEAGAYDKIVLFAVHKILIHELRIALREFGAVTLFGGTPPQKREAHIKRFQTDKTCRVFIGQVIAAGTAINLTAAHQVGVVEADWVPSNNQQAVMRCHRIGQTKPVNVRFFSIANSIDERIHRVLKQKTRTLVELWDKPVNADGSGP